MGLEEASTSHQCWIPELDGDGQPWPSGDQVFRRDVTPAEYTRISIYRVLEEAMPGEVTSCWIPQKATVRVQSQSCPWGSTAGDYQGEGVMEEKPFPHRILQPSLKTKLDSKPAEKCVQGPAILSQKSQWRVDLKIRSNKLRTGILCARKGWLLLWKFFECEVPFGTSILDNVVLKSGRGLSLEVQIFRIVNRCVADRALGIDAIIQNKLVICKDANDKGKQHI